MASIQDDPRLDPRVMVVLGQIPTAPESDVADRDSMLAAAPTPVADVARSV